MYTCFAPALLRLRENAAEPVVAVRIGWIVVVPVSRPDNPIAVVPGAATQHSVFPRRGSAWVPGW